MSKQPARTRAGSGSPRTAVVVLAAGKGTRLKSQHPKVLHPVGGQPMVRYVIDTALKLVPAADIHAVIGHEAERVRTAVAETGVCFVEQTEQLGTGHALQMARPSLAGYDDVLVLSGDVPLISERQVRRLLDFHRQQRAAMTILTAEVEIPFGYGRIVRAGRGSAAVKAIVEEKALSAAQKKIREINSGTYVFGVQPLLRHLDQLRADNHAGEYYLTDLAGLLVKAREKVVGIRAHAGDCVLGSNTRAELAELDARLRFWKCEELMHSGVTIFKPETCIIDAGVEVGADTIIEPFVQLLGRTTVGSDCRIRSFSVISDSQIGAGVQIKPGCVLEQARVEEKAILGPYAHLRPGSEIGEGAHIGNFVETKKTRVGRGSKANHLTYLGDAVVGEDVNVGAGTITCNYDGATKHTTTIEDGAFIGSDSTLVAPVRVGKGAYVAAASCITEDVPEDALALGRSRQAVKEGWARERRARTAKK